MVNSMRILTFDIEEWFHILDNPSTESEKEWSNYESRILHNMDKIFNLIDKHNLNATFFVVGWIAEKYPSIAKKFDELVLKLDLIACRINVPNE